MDLEGNLAEIDVLPTLLNLHRRKFSGAVRFERDTLIKIIYFREGDVISASSNDSGDSIDEILVRAGKITRDHARQAVTQRKERESIAETLIGLGYVTRKELGWARRVQLVGIIRSVADWREGAYSIVDDYVPKRDEGTLFHLPQIVVEAIVTDPDRERYERGMEGGSAVYRRGIDFEEQYRHLGLNEEADRIVAQIDGMRTATELGELSSEGPFAVFKLLRALELLGLISRADTKPQVIHEVVEPQESVEILYPPEPSVVPTSPLQQEVTHGPEARSEVPRRRAGVRHAVLALVVTAAVIAAAYLLMRDRVESSPGPQSPAGSARRPVPVTTTGSPPSSTATAPRAVTSTQPVLATDPPNIAGTMTAPVSTTAASSTTPATSTAVPANVPATTTAPRVVPRPPAQPAETPRPASTQPADPLRARYDQMARAFAAEHADTPYSLQVELVCQTSSISRALEIGRGRIWFVPIQFRGQSCYRVFWGSYGTRAAAEQAKAEVPEIFGSSPAIIEVRQVLRP